MKRRARYLAAATGAMLAAAAAVFTPGTASAAPVRPDGCPSGTQLFATNPTNAWLATTASSYWLAGPGTIHYSQATAASVSNTNTVNFTVTGTVLAVTIATQLGKSVTTSTTVTETWGYDITVPSGVTARARVYKHGWRVNMKEEILNLNCTVTTIAGYVYFPDKATDNSEFCIARDSYPGTDTLVNSCSDH